MKSSLQFGGTFVATHRNANGEIVSVEEKHNLCPTEGLTYFNNVLFGGAASSSLYVGLYGNNYTPVATDVMSTFIASASEITAYSEVSRPTYVSVVNGVNVSNTASKVVFTFSSAATVRGCMLSTSSVKNGVTGSLVSASLFTSAKPMDIGDTLTVEYLFSSTSS